MISVFCELDRFCQGLELRQLESGTDRNRVNQTIKVGKREVDKPNAPDLALPN